jgi:hypothetical protein
MILGLTAGRSFAQTGARYPGPVQPVAYDATEYYAGDDAAQAPPAPKTAPTPPPAAEPAAPAAAAPAAADAGSCGCGCGCDNGHRWTNLLGDQCKLDCPDVKTNRWFDPDCHPWLKCENITVTGWIEAGISGHDGPRGDGYNGPDGFADRDGELQVNQVYTTIQRAVKPTDECTWVTGFTIDTLVGSDYRYPLSRGLDAQDNGNPRIYFDDRKFYGEAIPQAYLEVANTKWDFKIGHWYTLLGNEVVIPTGNFFYTHNYSFLYAYPFTHTGVLGTYTKDDYVTYNIGVEQGWDNFDDTDHGVGVIGGVTVKSCDKKTTLAYFFEDSREPIAGVTGPDANRFTNSIVVTENLTDRTTLVLENADGFQADGNGHGGDASWFGFTSWLTYQMNCCWTTGFRAEWFRDTNGTRVAPVGDFTVPPTPGANTASSGGFAGDFTDYTYGFNYKYSGNLTLRPEIRYDMYDPNGGTGPKPFSSGTSNHQWVYSCDAILLF